MCGLFIFICRPFNELWTKVSCLLSATFYEFSHVESEIRHLQGHIQSSHRLSRFKIKMQVHIGSLLVCNPGTSPVFQTEWDIWDITAAPRLATLCLSMVCMSPFTHSHTFLNISQFRKMTSNSPLVSPPPPGTRQCQTAHACFSFHLAWLGLLIRFLILQINGSWMVAKTILSSILQVRLQIGAEASSALKQSVIDRNGAS